MSTAEFEVVWPLGRRPQYPQSAAPQKAGQHAPLDLNSAKVAFLWNYTRKGDDMFAIMKETLRGEYPDISFVDYGEFGNIHGASETEVVAALPELIRRQNIDVAVVGIGG